MSVLSTQCDPVFSTSLGSEPEGVFLPTTLAFWGCGVTDSIRGFEPLDPGSIPGTLTGLSLLQGHVNVADITGVCEPSDLGSNPSMPANSTKFRKLGDEKMTEKKPNEMIPPEEMIDHNNANFLQIENVMTIFVAYNQNNIQDGTDWDTWPEWELCLSDFNSDIHFEMDDDSEEIRALRSQWLTVMQFIHDSEYIQVDGYKISVQGQHGNFFKFDICFDPEVWTDEPMDEFVHEIQDKYGTRFQKSIPFNCPSTIGHSLGELWVCPAHVPKYGGQQTYFTETWMCISKEHGDTFPSALHSLLCLCIDDTKIWADACQRDVDAVERAQWMEENWPGGIPDQDWEYQ